MEILNFVATSLVSMVLGLGGSLLFYRSRSRKEGAEAYKSEAVGLKSFADEWMGIAEKREKQIDIKDAKIDELYVTISDWRDKYNSVTEEMSAKRLENQQLKFISCSTKKCTGRDPQTGY